ncbi:MAG TPA: hypothetical protein VGE74_11150 [Gemmata sp.]
MPLVTQSGLQIATGGSSPSPDMERFAKIMGREEDGVGGEPKPLAKNKDEGVGSAPLLFLFPLALLAGIGIGCSPFPHLFRRLALAACCLGAFGIVGLQIAIGFPMEKEIGKKKEQLKGGNGLGGGFGAAPNTKGTKTGTKEPETLRVSWKLPLYLTFLLLLGATATAFVDGGLLSGAKKPKRRYRARDDEDEDDEDEDEEEEDERPKKKKKPVVEELPDGEEEERPRKKAKPALPVDDLPEDEPVAPPPKKSKSAAPPSRPAAGNEGANPFDFGADQPPKKRPARRDDDEEDDRPRKRRPRRDD